MPCLIPIRKDGETSASGRAPTSALSGEHADDCNKGDKQNLNY